jgi:hypothetical protein
LSHHVTVSPSPQPSNETDEKLHALREYTRDFRCRHTTDAQDFDWDSDDEDHGLADWMPGCHLTGGARAVGALADAQDGLDIAWTSIRDADSWDEGS